MSTLLSEAERLRLLADYGVMDTGADETLDEIVQLASAICGTPIALLSLTDGARASVADNDRVFVSPDVVQDGAKLGTLCVIDREPRTLTKTQELALETLSKLAVDHLHARRDEVVRSALDARLAAVLASISEAVVATDTLGLVTFINPVAERLAGLSSAACAGWPVAHMFKIFDGETSVKAEDLVAVALRDGKTVERAGSAHLRLPSEELLAIRDSASPVRNARGEIVGAVLVVRDVSESETTRMLVAEAWAVADVERQKLQNVFELSAELLCMTRDDFFTRVNPAFTTTLGWSEAELLARPVATFVHPDDAVRTAAQRGALEGGVQIRGYEARYQHKDGSWRWISWSATPLHGTTYAVGHDITGEKAIAQVRIKLAEEQRVARETAEQASLAMDEFLATVSHELRTPLSAMLGWTRLLMNDQVREEDRGKALATIERNAVAQTKLIEDLLDVSRIIAGKMRLDLVPVDLMKVVEAAVEVVGPAADAKGVVLRALLDPAAVHVTGDDSRLQQVIWNLLSNAIKFTPRGGHVDIRLVRAASSVEIEIRDNGSGIAPDFLQRVFLRFQQADASMTRAHGGLGLGLAIVKNIMELHGGTVRADSAGIGKGATFTLSLPLALLRPERAARMVADHPRVDGISRIFEFPPEVKGARILVVDDEDDARELLAAILTRCGAEVTSAGSVADAFQAFRTAPFDVVVSDLGMPDDDGYALVKRIRQLAPGDGGKTPVIALTAYARTEDRTRVLRAGFNIHVAKPIEPSELLAVIASFLERRSDY